MKLLSLLYHDVYERAPSESGFAGVAADRYKMPVERFVRHLQAIRSVRDEPPILIRSPRDLLARRTPFAITVDDGGLSYLKLAERLEDQRWLGHCFVTSGCIGRRGFMEAGHLRELHARGHLIGSHSATHPSFFHRLPWQEQVEEWKRSKAVLEDIIGAPVIAGSVPGGFYADRVARAARAAGLRILFTSEPERRVRMAGGCHVLGRYTLRRDSPPQVAARLVRQDPALLLREWLAWNGKKALKGSLGNGYVRLSQWLHSSS